ncbi:MAG: hypothetical protein IH969_10205, partial [Candidatus Krumholzibacteriota bacterium]|nr:hypothetical protein [Candidatus Krumholzibacteriota bacterium]
MRTFHALLLTVVLVLTLFAAPLFAGTKRGMQLVSKPGEGDKTLVVDTWVGNTKDLLVRQWSFTAIGDTMTLTIWHDATLTDSLVKWFPPGTG